MSDTIGSAWAIAHFGKTNLIIKEGSQLSEILSLPPEALRIGIEISERLHKLGLKTIRSFVNFPRSALKRRFGNDLLIRMDQASGMENESIVPVIPLVPFSERLTSLEPIVTLTGIEIALKKLLELLCKRLTDEQKGIRLARFSCYRIDGKIEQVEIGTNTGSANPIHLFRLFEIKLSSIEPSFGIEVFVLEALKTDDLFTHQEKIWEDASGSNQLLISELIDRLLNK